MVNVQVKIKDLSALAAAVKSLGYEWKHGQKTYAWFGKWVGDTPMPEGLTVDDLGKCEHAIGVPGADYEVGVVAKPDGTFELRYDFWSSGGLHPILGQNAGPIVQAYGVQTVLQTARVEQRAVLSQKTLASGAIEITLLGR
jgi:hypothetical protein